MAFVVKDRVKETTATTGTGAITLGGAVANFVTFSSVLSDGDTTYYAIVDDGNGAFEVGLGTYASAGTTLTRTTVLASSNSGSAVDLQAGTKNVFITYPADKSLYLDAAGDLVGQTIKTFTLSGGTANGTTIGNSIPAAGTFTAFTSTGIDDNATSTALTINSNGNATFAGVLTAASLELESTDDSILTLRSTDDGPVYMEFERGTDRHAYMGLASSGDDFYIKNEETTGDIRLQTSDGSELRIDAGGDVKITSGDLDVTTADGGGISVTGGTGNYDNSAFTFYQGGRARFGYDGSGSGKVSISDYNSSGTTLNKLIAFETHGAEVMRIDETAVEFKKGIEEQQYNLTGESSTAALIDPANGTIQYRSMQNDTTYTESLSNGEFVTLIITPVFNSTATWPTISWIGGSAPVLTNGTANVIELWHVSGTLYGAYVGAT